MRTERHVINGPLLPNPLRVLVERSRFFPGIAAAMAQQWG